MKTILSITLVLVVLAVAILGSMAIFGVLSYEYAVTTLLKVVGAMVLLGGCSAVISFVMRSKDDP